MFKLTLIKSDQSARYDITPLVGEIAWDSNFSLMAALEMEIAYSDTRFFPKNPCDVGDHVILTKDKDEIFRGVIVNETRSGRGPIRYTVYDYAWYLCNSTTVCQFNKISATQAVTKILNDFGMKIGSMLTMPTLVDKIYIQECPACIIEDILTQVENKEGYKINVEMRQGKIYFEKRQDLVIEGRFRLADNLGERDVLQAIGESNRTRSIEEMRNRIRIIAELEQEKEDKKKKKKKKEPEYKITAVTEDQDLISQYGLLEETFKIDAKDMAKSRQVAKILLKRLGRIHETNSLSLIGDIRFKAGRLFDVSEPITGMEQRYMIANVQHRVKNQNHTMDLELVLPEDVM